MAAILSVLPRSRGPERCPGPAFGNVTRAALLDFPGGSDTDPDRSDRNDDEALTGSILCPATAAKGNGAVWLGTTALIMATGAVVLALDRNWFWAVIVASIAGVEVWLMKGAIRRRNF